MRMTFFLVPVAQIICNYPNKINPDLLQRAAKSIVSGHGIINPIILKATGIDRYELVDGIFEYYAAVEAERLDPMRCELINAYIIPQGQNHQFIAEQVELFRRQSNQPNNNHGPLSIMNSIDAVVEAVMQRIMPELKKITERLAALEAKFTQPDLSPPITEQKAFEPVVPEPVETMAIVAEPIIVSPINEPPVVLPLSLDPLDPFIEFLNTASLGELTALKSGLKKTQIGYIINERKAGEYQSKQDFLTRLETQGIKEQSYTKLLNKWQAQQPTRTETSDELQVVTKSPANVTPTILETVQSEPIISTVPNLSAAAIPINSVNDVVNSNANKSTLPTQQQIILEDDEFIPEAIAQPASAPLSSIDRFNSMSKKELMVTLKHLGIPTANIQIIVEKRPLSSFNDLGKIKGMGKKRVDSIIEKFA